jgi:hypothetical protein
MSNVNHRTYRINYEDFYKQNTEQNCWAKARIEKTHFSASVSAVMLVKKDMGNQNVSK